MPERRRIITVPTVTRRRMNNGGVPPSLRPSFGMHVVSPTLGNLEIDLQNRTVNINGQPVVVRTCEAIRRNGQVILDLGITMPPGQRAATPRGEQYNGASIDEVLPNGSLSPVAAGQRLQWAATETGRTSSARPNTSNVSRSGGQRAVNADDVMVRIQELVDHGRLTPAVASSMRALLISNSMMPSEAMRVVNDTVTPQGVVGVIEVDHRTGRRTTPPDHIARRLAESRRQSAMVERRRMLGDMAHLPNGERREKIFYVREREILYAFYRENHDCYPVGIDPELPPGAMLRSVYHDPGRAAFAFIVYHPSFDLVQEGTAPPEAGFMAFQYRVMTRAADGRYDLGSAPLE